MTTPAKSSRSAASPYARVESLMSLVLLLVVFGLLAWLSQRYSYTADWTASGRHTLAEASRVLVEGMEGPIRITAYASQDPPLRNSIKELIGRYQRIKPDLDLVFVDPDEVPEQVRSLGITVDGELIINYAGRSEQITRQNEEEVSNALQKLTRGGERFLVFLEGHGERAARGQANHDLQRFTDQLDGRGINIQTLNLATSRQIPENTSALVIAGPTVDLTAAEAGAIGDYLDRGGNLLWLIDDGALRALDSLAARLGVALVPGSIVDPTTQDLKIPDPQFVLVTGYPPSPVLGNFDLVTILPTATGLKVTAPAGWTATDLFQSAAEAWSESEIKQGVVAFDAAKDLPGPLTLGVALTRPRPAAAVPAAPAAEPDQAPSASAETTPAPAATTDTSVADTTDTTASTAVPAVPQARAAGEQRVVVVGDGDFLANAYLGNSGNLDLGVKLVNWLAGDEQLLNVPARLARDTQIDLSPFSQAVIGLGALFGLPLGLLAAGFSLWWWRRRAA